MKTYTITKEQLDNIRHYKDMFELNASKLQDLCNSGKDDIVYGFELGQMYSHLRECYLEMNEIMSNISHQNNESTPFPLKDK